MGFRKFEQFYFLRLISKRCSSRNAINFIESCNERYLYRLLCWFRLEFVIAELKHIADQHKLHIRCTFFQNNLSDCFVEGHTFDIAHRSSELDQDDIWSFFVLSDLFFFDSIDLILDLGSYMRNDLYSFPSILPRSFLASMLEFV